MQTRLSPGGFDSPPLRTNPIAETSIPAGACLAMSAGPSNHTSRAAIARRVEDAGVVAVIRLQDPARLRSVVDALAAGGVRALEITMTVPRAIESIADIAPSLKDEFLLGAGTVLDPDTAGRVIDAGAAFVVSPVFR